MIEFLEQSRSLLDTLKNRSQELEEVKRSMQNATFDNLEVLYAEEFELVIEMTDVYETLKLMLDKMSETEESVFIANRLRTQAESIIGVHYDYDIG